MKTTFRRLFAMSATLILLCLLLLGITFRLMLDRHLEEQLHQRMQSNAQVMVNLAAAYDAMGELEYRWGDFHICLTTAAYSSDSEIFLCELDGTVRICSCLDSDCRHTQAIVSQELIDEIVARGDVFLEREMDGLYDAVQYVQAMPVMSPVSEEMIGVLIVTSPRNQNASTSVQATTIFFYVSVFVLVVALIMSYLMSRNQSRALEEVANAATRFAHGDLDARAAVGGKNTEEADALATAFNSMAQSLANSERQRKEFVANVSHELKTPMTTIAGFVDGMLDGTIPQESHNHYMRLVSDEVRRLSRLVRSMLEISRLQANGIAEEKKQRFDLCEAIGQVLVSFEQRVNRKRIHMEVELPDRSVYTKADPDSITQVIYNLTDNAIKFCNEAGRLRVCLQVEAGKARVIIQNTGPTIAPEDLPLIFDRFQKADKSRSADPDGVGLGLYIVKTILDCHGEDIYVTSENELTTFTFTLPVVR